MDSGATNDRIDHLRRLAAPDKARTRFAHPLRCARDSHFATRVRRDRQARLPQLRAAMAAVMALVFLFVLASVGLLFRVFVGDPTVTSIFTFILFFAMASGVFIGCFKMARKWEGDPGH